MRLIPQPLAVLALVLVVFASPCTAAPDLAVGEGGDYLLVRYRTDGSVLQRYTGFTRIADVAVYDAATVLVAEPERNRITAVGLDGQIAWQVNVQQPRCIQVLGPDRLLICQDSPPRVSEIDRSGQVFWQVGSPLVDAAGALRLPDGNTAVVEGRAGHHAVHVLDLAGKILWSGTQFVAQPRGLVRLPSGELATSGFDTGRIVFFTPYSDKVRWVPFCCHAEGPSLAPNGQMLAVSPETQVVHAFAAGTAKTWEFSTIYPPLDAEMLADGSVMVSLYRLPDRTCLNVAHVDEVAARPLAPYWRALLAGTGGAALLVLLVQWPVIRQRRGVPTELPRSGSAPPVLGTWRRVEIGVCMLAALLCGAAGALHHQRMAGAIGDVWTYAAWVVAAGFFLALLQYRLPLPPDDWSLRMRHLAPMAPATRRMWGLWIVGLALVLVGLEGVANKRGEWVTAAWSAGVVLLAGGSLQAPPPRRRIRPWALVVGVAIAAVMLALRLYELEAYPPNLHHDMALWSVQGFRLLDGDVPTLFTNGWAEVPMIGYLWSGLVTAIGGRSLAACRLPSAIGSVLAMTAMFFLIRRLYGTAAGVVAVLLIGVHQAFFHFSRIQAYMDPVPFHVLALLALVAGLENGRYSWFAIAGLAAGYSGLTYHAGRITPPLLAVLAAVLLLRYPRALLKRWPGLLLCAVVGLSVLGTQAVIYAGGRADPFGRSDQFVWLRTGVVDWELLRTTLAIGLPRVLGSLWFVGDTSTQYGGAVAFFPPVGMLLGMAVVAALLRPLDIRGLWVLVWGVGVLFIGGVLTVDPPFWPRLVIAFIPATVLVAGSIAWLWRGAAAAGGRIGTGLMCLALAALIGANAQQQLTAYADFVHGTVPELARPVRDTQWVQGIMGRDVQQWGRDAMIYIVAPNHNVQSCSHPTMQYYADAVDAQDARDIGAYMPFKDPRTIVAYFLPTAGADIAAVRALYPDAEVREFHSNLGRHVFTRVVVRAPHA